MKARIYLEEPRTPNYVTVRDEDGNETTYFCPRDGGYVRVHDPERGHPQVCDGLARRGPTLHCSNGADLIGLIRSERKRRMDTERRERLR